MGHSSWGQLHSPLQPLWTSIDSHLLSLPRITSHKLLVFVGYGHYAILIATQSHVVINNIVVWKLPTSGFISIVNICIAKLFGIVISMYQSLVLLTKFFVLALVSCLWSITNYHLHHITISLDMCSVFPTYILTFLLIHVTLSCQ